MKSITTCTQAHNLTAVLNNAKCIRTQCFNARYHTTCGTIYNSPQRLVRTYSTTVTNGSAGVDGFAVDEEVATPRVRDILKGVYNGERAKLAEAITLGDLIVLLSLFLILRQL